MNLLVSGTVNPGDPLSGWFRYDAVNPTLLPVGKNYRIAAVTGSEKYTYEPYMFNARPEIKFIGSRETSESNTLVYPVYGDSVVGIFGPNFQFTVPEPSSLLLLGFGLLGAFFGLRKKLQK